MGEIVGGAIGSVGKYDVSFTAGKMLIAGQAGLDGFSVQLSIGIDSKVVLDAIAAKVGGTLAPEVALLLETALAAI